MQFIYGLFYEVTTLLVLLFCGGDDSF